jgi:hypothetical protein
MKVLMEDLASLFNKYGSDKDRNGYSHLYSILFDHLKNNEMNVLEVGIGTMTEGAASSMKGYMPDSYLPGASLRAWRDYFVNSQVYGADVQPDTQFEETRIKTFLCDSTSRDAVNAVIGASGLKFDIIVDDGWHWDNAQISTLKNFFPYLKEGGIYVIEDIYPGSGLSANPDLIRDTIGPYEYYYVGLKNNQCVIRKRITTAQGHC